MMLLYLKMVQCQTVSKRRQMYIIIWRLVECHKQEMLPGCQLYCQYCCLGVHCTIDVHTIPHTIFPNSLH
jgi:hypothetical protein